MALFFVIALIPAMTACGTGTAGDNGATQATEAQADIAQDSEAENVDNGAETNATDTAQGAELTSDEEKAIRTEAVKMGAAYFESVLGSDLEKYTKEDIDPEKDSPRINYIWDSSKSAKPENEMVLDITIDGQRITSDTNISELIAAGYELKGGDEEIEPNYRVGTFYCYTNTGRELHMILANYTDATKKAKDCTVYSLDLCKNVEGAVYHNLTAGSSISDAIRELGFPDSIYISYNVNTKEPKFSMNYGYGSNSVELRFNYNSAKNNSELYDLHHT